jgi:uncharacterized protein (TIGR00369 family)
MTLDDDIAARVRSSFARQSMMSTLDAEMTALDAGLCTLSAPILPLARQQHDAGHAALTFALGDTAAGYAALTLFPPDREVMTVEMKINLLSPATGDRLVAEGRVVRSGKRLTVVAAEVWAESDGTRRQVAILQGTMIPV